MLQPLRNFVRRNRTPIGLSVSLLLHVVIVCLLVIPSSDRSAGLNDAAFGPDNQTGLNIDMYVPAATGTKVARPAPATQVLDSFTKMTHPTSIEPIPLQAPKPSASLADVFGKDMIAEAPKQAQTSKPTEDDSHIKIGDRDAKTANDLWKAIAPCWHQLANKDTMGVSLNVSFSVVGSLSKPPMILREVSPKLNDHRLKSESLAIAALAQCGPYPMALGQSDVTVNFPAGG